jgi:hypothetical protein
LLRAEQICDLHEAALEKNIQARIADDEVIVEFLCRDARDYRMAVVKKRRVYPYNEPYKPNPDEHASDGWHYKNMSRLQRIIRMGKSKYTLSDRENMFRDMQRAAKAVNLRLSLYRGVALQIFDYPDIVFFLAVLGLLAGTSEAASVQIQPSGQRRVERR